ncbi:MAG: hypothetical protein WDZ35_10805 [Crocinitomicaceae bacterium]
MKCFLLIAYVLIITCGCAQGINNVKADSIKYVRDSTRAVLKKGKKTGLYNVKKEVFEIPYSKNTSIVVFEEKEVYVALTKSGFELYVSKGESLANQTFIYEGELKNDHFRIEQLDEERFLFVIFDEAAIQINENGFSVSGDSGNYFSGVYDCSNEKWSIPSKYEQVDKVNEYIICRKVHTLPYQENYLEGQFYQEFTYDIYRYTPEGIKGIKKNLKTADPQLFSQLLQVDSVSIQSDSLHMLCWRAGKAGLVRYHLPFSLMEAYYDNGSDRLPFFEKVLDIQYDVISMSDFNDLLVLFNKNDTMAPLKILEKQEDQKWDTIATAQKKLLIERQFDNILNLLEDEKLTTGEIDYWHELDFSEEVLGLELLNDTQIVVTNYYFQSSVYDARTELGEPLLNSSGNPVYLKETEYEQNSGVYHLHQKKWGLDQNHQNVYRIKSGWLVSDMLPEGESMYPGYNENYQILDVNQEGIESGLDVDGLLTDPDFIPEFLYDKQVDSVYPVPTGQPDLDWIMTENNYYVEIPNEGLGFFRGSKDFGTLYELDIADQFVYFNPEFKFGILVNDSAWEIRLRNDTLTVEAPKSFDLKIYAEIEVDGVVKDLYQLTLVSFEGDTTHLSTIPDERKKSITEPSYEYHIHQLGDVVVVNEKREEMYPYFDSWGYGGDLIQETEGSAVWKKTESHWRKVSPYYASIEVIPFGFIAKTAELSGNPKLDEHGVVYYDEQNEMVLEGSRKGRYILLDSSLSAINFLDYFEFEKIEDLDYGVKVCTDNGCMFVDYSGNALTVAEWDEFERVGEQIKAIKKGVEKIDPFGAIELDENGDVIYTSEPKEAFFKLPKK